MPMMTLRYEVNPPKVIQSNVVSHDELQRSLDNIKQRIVNISKYCNGIHVTDSVLGIPRVSPLTLATLIRDFRKKIEITISLRVIDKTLSVLTQSVSDAVSLGLNGALILKGDASSDSPKDSGLIPSQIVKHLNELGFNKKIDLFLSLPSNPDFKKIGKKLDAEPAGFITQVIHSEKQVTRIVDELKPQGFKVIPCVLLPSEKNANSAKFLKLDWSGYQNNIVDFIKNIHNIAGDVLVSSPNDYAKAQSLFESL
jgi:homocysteine S-methyltransferase